MTVERSLQLAGFLFLVVVVLTHVAEKLDLFPGMRWVLPDSPGHYLDLVSAVLGGTLLITGVIIALARRRRRTRPSNRQSREAIVVGDAAAMTAMPPTVISPCACAHAARPRNH
jgi:hypothetical protein